MQLFYDNRKSIELIKMVLDDYWDFVISNKKKSSSINDAKRIYEEVITDGLVVNGKTMVEREDYVFALSMNTWISWLLYQFAPEYFFPNLIEYQALNFYRIADTFNLELPPVPKKSDHKARCMYYWELCEVFYKFRTENNLNPSEFCAFLYDYAPNFIPNNDGEMPQASQVWMIGGKVNEIDHIDERFVFWQGNQDTRRGDILIHYETSPVSAITHIWQAATDGMIDPFYHYYGCTYITNRNDIPHITLDEIKSDRYFSSHPLVKKNFQGVNGWPMSASDYNRILMILERKGCDISKFPRLFTPAIEMRDDIKVERDVEVFLLEPLLAQMEITDYQRQVSLKFGRTDRGIPDYILHAKEKNGDISAGVIIEAKYHMKTPLETHEAFEQARSYAYNLRAHTLVLCDKVHIMVYEIKDGNFDRQKYTTFQWEELKNADKFIKLKRLLE